MHYFRSKKQQKDWEELANGRPSLGSAKAGCSEQKWAGAPWFAKANLRKLFRKGEVPLLEEWPRVIVETT